MATPRDYGSLSKACPKLLIPLIRDLGYEKNTGISYFRQRAELHDVIILQQSQWGAGDFCVHAGVGSTALEKYWPSLGERGRMVFGCCIGRNGEQFTQHWWSAIDKEDLGESLVQVANAISNADAWIKAIASISDLESAYASGLGESGSRVYLDHVIQGGLLLEAGIPSAAKEHFVAAKAQLEGVIEELRTEHMNSRRSKNTPYVPPQLQIDRLECIERNICLAANAANNSLQGRRP